MRVITANVNGTRAGVWRGALPWLVSQEPDVLCLQEVRATDTDLLKALADAGLGDWASPTVVTDHGPLTIASAYVHTARRRRTDRWRSTPSSRR